MARFPRTRGGLLTAPLASPYFLGFLGVAGACRKSPMKSRRKVNIIHHYQTQPSVNLGAQYPGP